MALRGKQQRFVDEYLIDRNATQAAIRAGYSAKTAYSIGEQNLKKLEVKKPLKKAKRTCRTQQDHSRQGIKSLMGNGNG